MRNMNRLTKNYIYNSAYQLLAVLIPLLTTPYLTRTLGTNSLGIDSYVLSVVQLAEVLGTLGTNTYANREIAYVRDDREKLTKTFLEIFLLRLVLCVLVVFVYVGIALRSEYRTVFLIQTVTLICYFFDISWLFIGMEEMKPVVMRNICVKLLVTACIFLLIREPDDLLRYVAITASGQLLGDLLMAWQGRRYLKIEGIGRLNIRRHIRPVLLLFLPQAASSLYVLFDKTMLGLLSEQIDSVSLYDKAESLVKTPLVFATAMTAVLMPRIANEFAAGHREKIKELVQGSIDFMIMVFLPVTLGMAVIAGRFVPWYLGEAYRASIVVTRILSPVILAIALSNVSGTQFLVATKETKVLTISYVAGALFNLTGNFLLIPLYNERGAAVTTVCAEWLVTLIQLYALQKRLGSLHLFRNNWKKLAAALAMLLLIVPMNRLTDSIWVVLLQILSGGILYFALLLFLKEKRLIEALHKFCARRGVGE
ncbi:MAG: flippase [Lachnospiraceae bacterium]|nr:flippase [Lachnospiraceae bacterium]